jgi:sulfatase maturation enzyme AslB (radical SAM superfamily)
MATVIDNTKSSYSPFLTHTLPLGARLSFKTALILKKMRRELLQFHAKVQGSVFYCRALCGEEGHIMAITSDMNLVCNCHDKYGLGKLGNIRSTGFREILSGTQARSLRDSLGKGYLPIINCATCSSLASVKRQDLHQHLPDGLVPSAIYVENTSNCNLNCIGCERNLIRRNRTQQNMSLADIEELSAWLKENAVNTVFYFNYGEPFLSFTIEEEIGIIKRHNPYIRLVTSTNGTLLDSDSKQRAALAFNQIFFTIPGLNEEVCRKYQKGGSFSASYKNMGDLVKLRNSKNAATPFIEWKYLIFRWNDNPKFIDQAIALARKAGVNAISFWPTITPIHGISLRYSMKYFLHKKKLQPDLHMLKYTSR